MNFLEASRNESFYNIESTRFDVMIQFGIYVRVLPWLFSALRVQIVASLIARTL